jgi:hypothetical protein
MQVAQGLEDRYQWFGVERNVRYLGHQVDYWLGNQAWNRRAPDVLDTNDQSLCLRQKILGLRRECDGPTGIVASQLDMS